MFKGLHHLHQRKRLYEKHEPYPHPDRAKRIMDRLIYVFAVLAPILSLPQLIGIWVYRNSAGVSALTWGLLGVMAFFWLLYGIMHREKPIILTNVLWIIFDAAIVIGIFVI